MQAARYVTQVDSNIQLSEHQTQGLVVTTHPMYHIAGVWSVGDYYHKFIWGGPGGVVSSSAPADTTTVTVTSVASKLLCRGGDLDVSMPGLDSYHDAEDYAQVNYYARCGARTASPAVIPQDRNEAVGLTDTAPIFPALVGWI